MNNQAKFILLGVVLCLFANCNAQLFHRKQQDSTLLFVGYKFPVGECKKFIEDKRCLTIKDIFIDVNEIQDNDSISMIDWSQFLNVDYLLFKNTDAFGGKISTYNVKYKFPISIYNIKGIKELRYCDLNMDEIPNQIGNLDSLRYLKIQNIINLNALPASICKLQKLETIEFDFTKITNIPPCIKECKSLKTIRYQNGYKHQKLDTVFSIFSTIPNLNYLDVWNRSNYYPFNKYKFEKVAYLSITQGKINMKKTFSKPENLPNLKAVDFSGSKFNKMPIELGDFKSIDTLVMIDATVKKITSDIVKLNNIKVLYINTLKDEELKKIKILLPNCEIISERPKGYIVW
jgi:hypothetical protein